MKIRNGYFQHRNIYRYTWFQDSRGLKSTIDHIIKQKSRIKATFLKGQLFIKYYPKQQNEANYHMIEKGKTNHLRSNLDDPQDDSTSFLYRLRLLNKAQESFSENTEECYYNMRKISRNPHTKHWPQPIQKNYNTKEYWRTRDKESAANEKVRLYHKWLNKGAFENRRAYVKQSYHVKHSETDKELILGSKVYRNK